MDLWKLVGFACFLLVFIVTQIKCSPQGGGGLRGRAFGGTNRINDIDDNDDDYDDYDNKPRKYGRRGYRSRCRCAKISNCPKLQITIPRCPPEEFVCCFT